MVPRSMPPLFLEELNQTTAIIPVFLSFSRLTGLSIGKFLPALELPFR